MINNYFYSLYLINCYFIIQSMLMLLLLDLIGSQNHTVILLPCMLQLISHFICYIMLMVYIIPVSFVSHSCNVPMNSDTCIIGPCYNTVMSACYRHFTVVLMSNLLLFYMLRNAVIPLHFIYLKYTTTCASSLICLYAYIGVLFWNCFHNLNIFVYCHNVPGCSVGNKNSYD